MKKTLAILVAVIMIAAMIPAVVSAEGEYVSPGNILVPYSSGEGITIDGTMTQGEWSETNKLTLNETNLVPWAGEYYGPIDYYYSWGDKGLYMAAVVSDNELTYSETGSATGGRFQIALNPAGIISTDYAGLFFSFAPGADKDDEGTLVPNGNVNAIKHNWESSADGQVAIEHEDYQGKYTVTKDADGKTLGWVMEVVLPWALIATEDRWTDLDDTDTIMLTNFNPKDENRARAFCTATICYVQVKASDGSVQTGRTTTDGVVTWECDSYDVVLLFMLDGETTRDSATAYFTAAPETDPPATDAPASTAAPETNAPETNAPETNAPGTAAPGTAAPGTSGGGTEPAEDSNLTWLWIVIGVVAVAAIVVIVIVVSKKKK